MPQDALPRLIEAVTGWDFKEDDVLRTGKRIMNMRHVFNLREGQKRCRQSASNQMRWRPAAYGRPFEGRDCRSPQTGRPIL